MNLSKQYIKSKALVLVLVSYGAVFATISLVNHYNFRTSALDLGLYTNALWDYAHFQWNDSSLFKMYDENLLADHFDLYLVVFAHFSWLFGSYTLLIFQILSLLFAAVGIYKYFENSSISKLQLIATIYFLTFFGVIGALTYDYHSNVVAASLLPWYFLVVKRKNILWSFIILIFMFIGKENMSLWLIFVNLGLVIKYFNDKMLRNYLLIATAFSLGYFIIIYGLVMPGLSVNKALNFRYNYLGNTIMDAIIFPFSHPVLFAKGLVLNHHPSEIYNMYKIELHFSLLLSGLFLLIKKPYYLIMLIPIYFQKLFHDYPLVWGIGLQYNIEFAPILAIGVFEVIDSWKRTSLKIIWAFLVLASTIAVTIYTMDTPYFYVQKSKIRFYQADHYFREYDIGKVKKKLREIPKNAKVCAHSRFVPHLAWRDFCYEFPRVKDAQFVILSKFEDFISTTKDEVRMTEDKLRNSYEWEVIYDQEITIFERRDSKFDE